MPTHHAIDYIEFNEWGAFAGVDHDLSGCAPEEPSHMECNLQDVVPVVLNEPNVAPMGFEPNAC